MECPHNHGARSVSPQHLNRFLFCASLALLLSSVALAALAELVQCHCPPDHAQPYTSLGVVEGDAVSVYHAADRECHLPDRAKALALAPFDWPDRASVLERLTG